MTTETNTIDIKYFIKRHYTNSTNKKYTVKYAFQYNRMSMSCGPGRLVDELCNQCYFNSVSDCKEWIRKYFIKNSKFNQNDMRFIIKKRVTIIKISTVCY